MGKNVGTIDRVLRFVVGAVLIALFFVGVPSPWNYVAIVAGVVLVGTGLVGFCPAYRLVGLRTCPVEART